MLKNNNIDVTTQFVFVETLLVVKD